MKNLLSWISLFLSVTALIFSWVTFAEKNKIVYVDSLKLISNYLGSKAAREEYEKKVVVWKANIDTLTSEFNRATSRHEKEAPKMNPREKKLSEELVAAKQQQLVSYRQATAENASKEDKEITAKVFSEINDFLKQYGEKEGYEFILAATSSGNIVFAQKDKNVTDEVLEKLNAEYQSTHK